MNSDFNLMPNEDAKDVIITAIEHLAEWPIKTAESFRNAALDGSYFAINPLLDITQEAHVTFIRDYVRTTVSEGRMIDFGYVPNDVVKAEAIRARDAFELGELQHPFESWLGVMSWEGGCCGYHVCPHPYSIGEILIFELYGITMPDGHHMILVYDIVSIEVRGPGNTAMYPAHMLMEQCNADVELKKRSANSVDPLVTMLRFLADASLPITYKPAPDRLNKHRIKQGKPNIPAHTVVATRDYVAAFHGVRDKPVSKGGHHASPVAHWRRAHKRTLTDGRIIPVRSSKVNWRNAEELHRMFYRTPDKK